jgi:hypothetical protein
LSSPEFKAAQKFVLRFGTHQDKPLDVAAETDDGLLYLEWLRKQEWVKEPLRGHLNAYLSDTTIQKELGLIHAKRRNSR